MIKSHRLYRRGTTGIWWVDFGLIGGVRHKRTTRHTDRDKAAAVASEIGIELTRHSNAERIKKLTIAEASPPWAASLQQEAASIVFDRLWKNARSRAKQSGKVWALSRDDFNALVAASDGVCAVTGLPFALTSESRHPFKPSIDRIDNSMGYSIGNARLVLLAVNMAMNVWGAELFKTVALSYAATHLRSTVQIGYTISRNAEGAAKSLI